MDENRFFGTQERKSYLGGTDVKVFHKVVPDPRAKMAEECIRQWGMVAGVPDGEDSAGRSRLRLATVNELVARACASADTLYAEFDKRGWLVSIPSPRVPDGE